MPIIRKYPKYVAIYVPSSDKDGRNLAPEIHEKALKNVRDKFRSWCGGSTSKPQMKERIFEDPNIVGEFDPDMGKIAIREEIILVYGYYSDDEAARVEKELPKLAEHLCKKCDQECVAIIIDDEFQLIAPD